MKAIKTKQEAVKIDWKQVSNSITEASLEELLVILELYNQRQQTLYKEVQRKDISASARFNNNEKFAAKLREEIKNRINGKGFYIS